jgi:hypothetical protein
MEKLANRISYLRGLADGMEVGETSREGKIVTEMIQLLDDMYGELLELHARVEENERYAEAIDEDLEDLELYLYGDDDDLYETVGNCAEDMEPDDVYEEFVDTYDDEHLDTSYEIECPTCHEVIFLHEGVDEEGIHHYVIEPYRAEQLEPINPT